MLSFLQLLTYVWSWWGRKNWYFSLDGFCFLFKQPYKTRSMFISTPLWYLKLPIIILKGFKTTICASYQLSVQTQKDKRNQLSLPTEKICKLPTLTRTLLKRFLSHQTTAWEDLTGHAYELMPMINKEGQRSCRCNMLCSHSLSVQEIIWGPLPLVCSLIRPINI